MHIRFEFPHIKFEGQIMLQGSLRSLDILAEFSTISIRETTL